MGTISIENVYEEIIEYAKEYSVKKIVLFGSRARKTNYEKSDIDIAVYGCSNFMEFSIRIEEDLWSLLNVDLINMDEDVSEGLRKEIERDGVVLYEEI